ncbi:MAG: serine/threonine-protein kinase [Phycisphaerales bacterium]
MTRDAHRAATELFAALRDVPREFRAAAVHARCNGDATLRAAVQSLLDYHDRSAGILDRELDDVVASGDFDGCLASLAARRASGTPLPESISGYRVLSRLGEGGMGTVYLAEQNKPRRRVAIKVIRPGVGSGRLLQRFEFEQEVLGRLHHRGIAQIYEAGTAADGQPYFAMEYVDGRRLDQFARAHRLAHDDVLRLVQRVADAVQHAHERGVIHRDLKPSNILVTSDGEPKILDFGVARAIGPESAAITLDTNEARLLGTLSYMSPEQVADSRVALDARSDVYALGVILYELLSGRLPHDCSGRMLHDAARLILEHEPTRLGGLDRRLRGDVETIVGKALERDPAQRYGSAAELSRDIERYLAGEPIAARQESAIRLLRRRLRRSRGAVAAALVAVAVVASFAAYALVQAATQARLAEQERTERERADRATESADTARRLAQEQAVAAIAEANRADATSAFLVRLLGLADLDITQGDDTTIQTMLDRASRDVATAFESQPRAEAMLRSVLGRAHATRGDLAEADMHLTRAVELIRADPSATRRELYDALWPHSIVLADLADPGADLCRGAVRSLGRSIIETSSAPLAAALDALVRASGSRDFDATAWRAAFDAVRQASTDVNDEATDIALADQLVFCAAGMTSAARRPSACACLDAALAIERRVFPETNTRVVRTLAQLIDTTIRDKRPADAESLARQAIDLAGAGLPPTHWYLATLSSQLGEALAKQSRFADAEPLLVESATRLGDAGLQGRAQAVEALRRLVVLYRDWAKPAQLANAQRLLAIAVAGSARPVTREAFVMLCEGERREFLDAYDALKPELAKRTPALDAAVERFISTRRRLVPDDDPFAAVVSNALGALVKRTLDADAPKEPLIALLRESERIEATSPFAHDRKRAGTLWLLGEVLVEAGDYVEAERSVRAGIAILERGPVERYGFGGALRSLLGECLLEQGRYAEAETVLLPGIDDMRSTLGELGPDAQIGLHRVVELYLAWGHTDEALAHVHARLDLLLADGTHTGYMHEAAWQIARTAGLSPDAYRLAQTAAERSVALKPDSSFANATLGAARFRLGDLAGALAAFDAALRLRSDAPPEHLAFLAMTQAALGDREAAIASVARMDQALADAPLDARKVAARRRLAAFDEARAMLRIADRTP